MNSRRPSKVELYAAIRDARAGRSERELKRLHHVGWRTVKAALDSASPAPRRGRLRGQHLGAPRLIRRPPSCCWCRRLRGDRSTSRAAWTAARVTLSGPDVLVELAHLYSNPCLARSSLSCAIELVRHCARPTTPP
jgi:hypothetical protein